MAINCCKQNNINELKINSGYSLVELVVAVGVTMILSAIIVVFLSSASVQYLKNKEIIQENIDSETILAEFSMVSNYPSVQVKTGGAELLVENTYTSPTIKKHYFQRDDSIYLNNYEDNIFVNSKIIAKGYSVNFSFESNADYLKDILKVELTTPNSVTLERKVSVRDCEVTGLY